MGRNRSFNKATVLSAAAETFVRTGYEATSVDDLVTALGVHRGSLYNAFGSKRGLFRKALDHHVETTIGPLTDDPRALAERLVHGPGLDLILVAALELGREDERVASTVRSALAIVEPALGGDPSDPTRAIGLLGARLYARLAQ